jgi:hypothetical protein
MRKKTRKFASGGDILTGIGGALLIKSLYDKYKEGKGKDDEDSDYARKVKEFRSGKKDAEAPAVESKAEPKTISAGEKRAMAASKGRPELIPEGADEAVMRSDNYPTPKPKKLTSKAEKTKNVTPAAQDTSGEAPVKLGSQGNFKFSSKNFAPKGTQSVGETLGMVKPGEAKGTQTLGERIKGTMDSAGKSVVRTPQQRMTDAAREVEERRKKESGMRRGGAVKKYASGGSVGSASKRADGIAQRGKTKGRIC